MINYNIIHGILINMIYTWIPSQSLLSLLWCKLRLTRFRLIELNDSVSRDTQLNAFKCSMDDGSSSKDRSLVQLSTLRRLSREQCLMLSWSLVKRMQPLRFTDSRFWPLDKSGNSLNSLECERSIIFNCGIFCNN